MSFSDGPLFRDNYEIVKIHWQNLEIFSPRTTEPISTKLCTNHHLVKRIQVCSDKGPHPFPIGDEHEIAKIHCRNLNLSLQRAVFSQVSDVAHGPLVYLLVWVCVTHHFTKTVGTVLIYSLIIKQCKRCKLLTHFEKKLQTK